MRNFGYILFYHQKGYKAPTIYKWLISEGIPCTCENIHRFLQRFEVSGGIYRKPGSGRPSSITTEIKAMVEEEEMQRDDETTAKLLTNSGYSPCACFPSIFHFHVTVSPTTNSPPLWLSVGNTFSLDTLVTVSSSGQNIRRNGSFEWGT